MYSAIQKIVNYQLIYKSFFQLCRPRGVYICFIPGHFYCHGIREKRLDKIDNLLKSSVVTDKARQNEV